MPINYLQNEKMDEKVDVDKPFESLMQHILKIDEIAQLQPEQIESEASIRKPLYSKRIVQNLTLDSIIFRNALTYAVIMARLFLYRYFQYPTLILDPIIRSYSIIRINDDSDVRPFITGSWNNCRDLLLSAILFFQPHLIVAVILMGLSAMMTEGFVAKLCFCSYFITTQVILLNGLAS